MAEENPTTQSNETENVDLSGQTIKGYDLVERIGVGGFGAVYKAHQALVRRDVAIKVILPTYANDPDFIRRFEAEAQLVAHLEHIHIVPLYDFWRDHTGAYLVMRWLRGGSLQERLEKGHWPLNDVARIVDQIAGALTVAHRNNVIHRDLKPANVLLDEENNVYLADFGIAKDLGHITDFSTMTDEEGFFGSPDYVSPEQILLQEVSPQSDIYNMGLLIYKLLTGKKPFAGLQLSTLISKHLQDPLPHLHEIRPDLPEELNQIINKATEKDPADRYPDALSFAADFRTALALTGDVRLDALDHATPGAFTEQELGLLGDMLETQVEGIAPENPYKGLRAFQEADADEFYGRDGVVNQLLERMQGEDQTARFLPIIGPSGSGKSSLIRAGLLPRIRRGDVAGSDQWFIIDMIPGNHPMEELEAALLKIAVNPPSTLLEQLQEDERGLVRAVKRILPGSTHEQSELVLLIDQFEEVFTRVEDEKERSNFLKSLLAAAQDENSRLRIIFTMRADFYDRPLLYPDFGHLVRECTEVILPLSSEDLEKAINEPAEGVGLGLEQGLVQMIVADVGEQPGALPLLQYALTELFERRDGRWLTVDAYREIEGVSGALARRATELYEELNEAGQHAARQMFLRLVMLGEGTEDTRRRVVISELLSLQVDEAVMQKIIDVFGKYRLLTFDNDPGTRYPTVEVAHEALIRQWQLLRQWLTDNREQLQLQRRLATATGEWTASGKDTSFLASGTRLEQFEAWQEETELAMTDSERAYLQASLAERQRQEAEKAARKAHEEALERRSRNFLRALVTVMSVATVIAIGLSLFAFNQRSVAEENAVLAGENAATATVAQGEAMVQADNAATAAAIAEENAIEARSLAFISAAQLALANNNSDLAILLALEANNTGDPSIQTRRTLAEAAYEPGTRLVFEQHSERVTSVDYSPDGTTALSGARDSLMLYWDVETGEIIHTLEGHEDWVWDVQFSPDGQQALSASQDKTIILWDLETGEIIHTLEGHTGAVLSVAFNADGTQAVSGGRDSSLILWDLESGVIIQRMEHTAEIQAVAFSPSGFTALSGDIEGDVVLWNVGAGQPLLPPFTEESGGHTNQIWTVGYTPDERGMITGSEDSLLLLWSFETQQPIQRFEGHSSRVTSADLSADGTLLVSGSEDNSVILWDVATGAIIRRFVGHTFLVYDVAFSPDASSILSAAWDNTVRLWDTNYGALVRTFGDVDSAHTDDVLDAVFSPDGETVASASLDGTLRLWDVATGAEIQQLHGHDAPVNALAFSPDGEQLLSGSDDESVILWGLQTGDPIHRFEGHSDAVWAVDFSPDGTIAASGGRDNTIILWDLGTGEQINRLFGHTFRVTGVDFSPDGQFLISSAFDNVLILWDVATGEELRKFEGHTDWVRSVAFSPDGTTVVSGSADNTLILWDVEFATRLRQYEGHTALVFRVAFSPDGQYVLSGSADRSLILWDMDSGLEVQRFVGHTDDIRSVAFSPDGSSILSGSGDNSIRLWDVRLTLDELSEWVQANRYVREITCAERELYDVQPLCPRPTPIVLPGQSA